MRWKKKEHNPVEGDYRFKQRFAFIPTDTADGFTVWMGFYYVYQRYTTANRSFGNLRGAWQTREILSRVV
jgi:hypothetical protein